MSLVLPFCFPRSWVLSLKPGYSPRVGRTGTKGLTMIAGQRAREEGQVDVKEQEGQWGLLMEGWDRCLLGGVLSNIEF